MNFLLPLHARRPLRSILIGLSLLLVLGGCSEKAPDHPFLPWDIKVFPDGTSSVFGVHLGKDPMVEFKRVYNHKAELAMFADRNKHLSLEAYFGSMQVGPLSANVILVADASQKTLAQWADQTGKLESTPSGAWKMALPDDIIRKAQDLPIRSISYVPKATFTKDLIERRFGKPAEIVKGPLTDNEPVNYWLYPKKGVMITVTSDGQDVFQYIAPRQFDLLRQSIPKPPAADKDGKSGG